MTTCFQRAYLWVFRRIEGLQPPYSEAELKQMAFDPDTVTAAIGLQPTTTWRRGDPGPRGSRRFSNWTYELPERETYETEDVVLPLLDAIEPYADGLAAVHRMPQLTAGISVVVTMHGNRDTGDVPTAAICFSARTIQRLAHLGLSIDHDQYVELPG